MKRHLPQIRVLLSLGLMGSAAPFSGASAQASPKSVEDSVVKVFSTVCYPDLTRPWTKQAPQNITGSGVVIEGKRILSNAHVILYASEIQVQANQAGDKVTARVEAMAPDLDLAVLKLEDDSFFDSHPSLRRTQAMPKVRDAVMAYGYPTGGASLSITKGIVSRIEFAHYGNDVGGLRVQIDAAINPGNSGGPAVIEDKMIGLAFSRLVGAQNVGYIIPNEEIETFLEDIRDGQYEGKPSLWDQLQTLENPALRAYLKVSKNVEGLVVHRPASTNANYALKKWDIITHVGNYRLDNRGMIKLPGQDLAIGFRYVIPKIASNGRVRLNILRAGEELQVQVPVSVRQSSLMPPLSGAYPSYFVYGPLVFSSAVSDLLEGAIKTEAGARIVDELNTSGSPLVRRRGDRPAFEGERLVFVSSSFFPSKLVKGYDNPILQVVRNINGVRIKNLGQLVELLRDCTEEFITIEFSSRGGETLVFAREQLMSATEPLLAENSVRSQGSADMLAIWNANSARLALHK